MRYAKFTVKLGEPVETPRHGTYVRVRATAGPVILQVYEQLGDNTASFRPVPPNWAALLDVERFVGHSRDVASDFHICLSLHNVRCDLVNTFSTAEAGIANICPPSLAIYNGLSDLVLDTSD